MKQLVRLALLIALCTFLYMPQASADEFEGEDEGCGVFYKNYSWSLLSCMAASASGGCNAINGGFPVRDGCAGKVYAQVEHPPGCHHDYDSGWTTSDPFACSSNLE